MSIFLPSGPPTARGLVAPLAPLLAIFALGVLALMVFAPGYLSSGGFPLDDAWIHAVYGRSLLESGSLAWNSGVPATGATSPLWATVSALAHVLGGEAPGFVVATKVLGLALHLHTVLLIAYALSDEASRPDGVALASGALVALQPDLLAAAVSGMEVPLATAIAAAELLAVRRASWKWFGVLAGLGWLARPELCGFALSLPLFELARGRRWLGLRLLAAGVLGTGLSVGAQAWRNLAVSGRPLTDTFYAKAGRGHLEPEAVRRLLSQLPALDSVWALLGLAGLAGWVLWRAPGDDRRRLAAAALLSGLAFVVGSSVLIPPVDPYAFYHQRYLLPAAPLVLAAAPVLVEFGLRDAGHARRPVYAGLGLLVLLSFGAASARRFGRLANDARNIDDVQVAIGRTLASARPDDVVWTVDAGATRYFGSGFFVDLMGLNSPQLLSSEAPGFLNQHPPRYLVRFDAWQRQLGAPMPEKTFQVTTPYSVTSSPSMGRQTLVSCEPAAERFELVLLGRHLTGSCAAVAEAR